MGYDEYLASLTASLLISGALTVFFWRRHPAPGARALAVLCGMVFVWAAGYVVEVKSDTLSGFRIADSIEYIGIANVPVLLLIFTTQYTRYSTWIARRRFLLFIVPFITLVLVWSNSLHGLMWHDARLQTFGEFVIQTKTYGPWFWIHSIYSYALILFSIAVIGRGLFHPWKLYRNQLVIILIAIVLPVIWNIIYIWRAAPTYNIDMTPPAFAVSGLVLALGLFRFRILKIVPVARSIVVENMHDGVMVFNNENQVLDLNRAAEKMIGVSASELIGRPAELVLDKLPALRKYTQANTPSEAEIYIDAEHKQGYYEVYVIPLYDRRRNLIGRVVSLHDLTERKKMENSLKDYAKRITQVQEEERKRIAFELHDDTAQYLSILKLQLDAVLKSGKIQDSEILEKLKYLVSDADRAFQDVRRYSHELRPAVLEHLGLQAALEQMADDINKLNKLAVEVDTEGEDPGLNEDIKLSFFRIAQEALNNARKHSQAGDVKISLRFTNNLIKMSVTDNGAGFNTQEAAIQAANRGNMGLISMRERANLIGADLRIESAPGKGTSVTAEMILGAE
jgi:PAS domain S-box-containing protein